MSDNDDDEQPFGIGFQLPPEVGRALMREKNERDKNRLRMRDIQNRIYNFLDGLTEEQCRMLRYLLSGDDPKHVMAYNHLIDGQLITLLRLKHGALNPDGLGGDLDDDL